MLVAVEEPNDLRRSISFPITDPQLIVGRNSAKAINASDLRALAFLTWVGANDQLIPPRGVINYYCDTAARYSSLRGNKPDYANLKQAPLFFQYRQIMSTRP
jgi:hypothetical protein